MGWGIHLDFYINNQFIKNYPQKNLNLKNTEAQNFAFKEPPTKGFFHNISLYKQISAFFVTP